MTDVIETLAHLAAGKRLSALEAESLFDSMLTGRTDDAQIGAALGMMQVRGVSDEELLGGARSMRRHAISVPTRGISGVVLDTCGTGGAPKTFNISTVAAVVVAAAAPGQVAVAKHGNRSRTGRGSAELLEQLGVRIDAPVDVLGRCLVECGVCFCFAIQHHPAAKFAATARRSLAFPTIFNLLGPLCNPAGATHQVLGVFAEQFVAPMARTLAALGSTRAVVLHGHGGMDEFSTTGPTQAAWVEGGKTHLELLETSRVGIACPDPSVLIAADLQQGVAIARQVLGGVTGPCADIVCLNAALALQVCGVVSGLQEGLELARGAIARGDAAKTLGRLIQLSHEPG